MTIRDYISRKSVKLIRHIEIYGVDALKIEPPEVHTVRKSVEVHTLKPELHAGVRRIDLKKNLKCTTETADLLKGPVSSKGFHVRKYTKQDIKIHGMPKRRKINIWKATKRAQGQPIELQNKLTQQKNRPAVSRNEIILAWYSPIVDGAVIKLALNKQRGTLLVWYDPRSRKYKARGVYLIRRLGAGEKPEWRWV
mgnify:CR=1 FL=1